MVWCVISEVGCSKRGNSVKSGRKHRTYSHVLKSTPKQAISCRRKRGYGEKVVLFVRPDDTGSNFQHLLPYERCFPFKKDHQFKFSKFLPVEWNASDSFPEFEVTYSATQGMLGETLLCLKMADFLKIFTASEQHDCETISCTILYKTTT